MSESNSTVPDGFRLIPGFPRYAISEDGTIISICRDGRTADRKWCDARQIKPTPNRKGYLRVSLCAAGQKPKSVTVHVLVLLAHVGPRPDGMESRHLDGNKLNNHVSNLAWGTTTENRHDRILHGTSGEGEKNGCAKLTADKVRQIRRRAAAGERQCDLAREFCMSHGAIASIVHRRNWKHLP